MESPSVLIAGAGPAGLVLALSLLQNGISVRIIERDLAYHVGQRGAGVMPRSLELYNLLGVLPDVFDNSAAALPMRSYEMPGGREPVKTWRMSSIDEPTPAVPWPNAVMIAQDRTEAILRSHLRSFSCAVELGTRLLNFEQSSEYVDARIVKVVEGNEVHETVRARWLVGADGAHSIVRKELGLSFLGETRSERFVIADVHLQGLDMHVSLISVIARIICMDLYSFFPPFFQHIHVFGGGPSGVILIWPSERKDGDLMTVYINGPDADYEKFASDHDAFRAYVNEKLRRADIVLGDFTWLTDYRPSVRMVETFQQGRIFLAGGLTDAAHVHSLGLNTSIQDSPILAIDYQFNLAWKLALVEKHLAPRELLSTYTQERLPVVAEVLNLTTVLLQKTMTAGKGDNSPWKRDETLGQLGINYRWSPIVVDKRAAALSQPSKSVSMSPYGVQDMEAICAGDRAPDAPELLDVEKNGTTSLFRIFGPSYHTILCFSATPVPLSKLTPLLKQYPPGLMRLFSVVQLGADPSTFVNSENGVLYDTKGHAYRNYSVTMDVPTLVVVRPDGMIGAIVTEEHGLMTYLEKVFVGLELLRGK
ncbi:hypothetical protein EW146_g2205 [Bondarzewia mesenterica]|uniref:FAD-binding domain-containing protein n=1 Tax=Bondarzewia mesenterica TaxID=1095465 RepID=A0A4S4M1F7_9AGAM|nr:hypothetical protein EW146_g2205 [Bondarzewia mesenterica]